MLQPSDQNCFCPDYIHPKHYQEWLDSCVNEEIINLNVKTLSGTTPHEYLLYGLPDSDRRNDGRLRDYWLRRYGHLDYGGWWCNGIDPLTGSESEWGCFKPDKPKIDPEKGKPIKYEHPPKVPTSAFFLKVPWGIGLKIAINCGLENSYRERIADLIGITATEIFLKTEDTEFWQWVKATPEINLLITEGAKKAASLLSTGYCTIGLSGIWNGVRQPLDDWGNVSSLPYLIPQLEPFAVLGREMSFCFDNDPKPKTKQAVRKATLKTGNLFKSKGCGVSVITWDSSSKGVDDLIAAKGLSYFDAVYNSRISLADYKLSEVLDLSPYVNLTVNERYLSESLVPPATAQLIGIKSWQGTGKTEWLARKIERLLTIGKRVIVIVHREQLAIALANRFGIDYRTAISTSETKGIFGYALCIDSLHPFANPKFNPQSWEEATVILDEVEQVIRHLLLGDTCINHRVAILKAFKELLQVVISTGGKICLTDADLSPISINYIQQLIGKDVETWVVENTFIPNKGKRKIYVYSDQSLVIQKACEAVASGKTILIHTDGQKHKSKWGTRNLEYYLKKKFPHARILRIDKDSVSDTKHPAYGCMGNLNDVLKNYDIVLASPTIETGVSIDEYIFDYVYCISHAVQSVDSVCQTLERYRLDVERHIYIHPYSTNRIGNGSFEIRGLLAGIQGKTSANLNQLIKAGISCEIAVIEDDLSISPSLLAYAKMACVLNSQAGNFKDHVLAKLIKMGYEVIHVSDEKDEAVQHEIIESKEELYETHCESVIASSNPTDLEYKELKEKRSKTEDERLKERKGKLVRRYQTENIDKELVKKDDDGWCEKILLHYYLTVGRNLLSERDKKILNKYKDAGDGQIFKPDLNNSLLSSKIAALELLGINQFFDPSAFFTSDKLQGWFDRINNPVTRSQMKLIFGISINPSKDTPMAVAQRLLDLMGLKCDFTGWHRVEGKAKRFYSCCNQNPDGRQAVFERWLSQSQYDEAAA